MDILKLASEKEADIRSQQRETVREAHKKDSEKRQFNWGLLGTVSTVLIGAVGIGASLLGGKLNSHIPKKL